MKNSISIYLIKNMINNKMYVGQTINYEKRMKEHKHGRNKGSISLIDKAIKKYCVDNFEFSIIDYAYSQDEADQLERKYIKIFDCITPKGYNILKGGKFKSGSWNQKKVYMYDLKGNYIREFESASELERLSNSFYLRHGITDCCRGKISRYKDKIFRFEKVVVDKYKKPKSARNRKVYQFDFDGNLLNSYESLQEASKKTNTSRSSISSCLTGTYKTANGFLWSYTIEPPKIEMSITRTKIIQLNDRNEIIGEYCSCSDAERKLSLKPKAYKVIYKYLDKDKRVYGFYWKKKR